MMNDFTNLYNSAYNFFKLNSSAVIKLHHEAYKKNANSSEPTIKFLGGKKPEFNSIFLNNFELRPGLEARLECQRSDSITQDTLSLIGFDKDQPGIHGKDPFSIWGCKGVIQIKKNSSGFDDSSKCSNIWNYHVLEILDNKGDSTLFRETIGPFCEKNGASLTYPVSLSSDSQFYDSTTLNFQAIDAAIEGHIPSCVNKHPWIPDINPDNYLLSSIPFALMTLAGLGYVISLTGKGINEQNSRWTMLPTAKKVYHVGLVAIPLALTLACQAAYRGF